MVITTPHVVRSFLTVDEAVRPSTKLINSAKSSITVQLTFKGCKPGDGHGARVHKTDMECYAKRITIGRVRECDLCIPDDSRISRYHAAIQCSRDGEWRFRNIGSKSGFSLKPKEEDGKGPKFGPVQPTTLDPKVPYLLQNHDVILIGRVHQGIAHEIEVTIHRLEDDMKEDDHLPQHGERVVTHKLTWRKSLHCNACMGWGRRHSCSARLSQLQKMIKDCNRQSNLTAPRPIKTAIQKVLFHRQSGWWPKKPESPNVIFKVPQRYENDVFQKVTVLPDELVVVPKEEDDNDNDDEDEDEDLTLEPKVL